MSISRAEVTMGRELEFPLSQVLEQNLNDLLLRLNKFRATYNLPMYVSSGYRPGHYNTDAGGAADSPHLECKACDFHDQDRSLTNWILQNKQVLVDCDLYMEDPAHTPTWVHLQSRRTVSGSRIFIP